MIDSDAREHHARGAAFPWRMLFVAIACVAIAVAIIAARALVRHGEDSRIQVRPAPNVVAAVRDLARLETVAYHMERVIELTEEQSHLGGLVNARDAILLVAAGDVIAGVDLAQLRPTDVVVDWTHRSVRLTAPAPQIFSFAVDSAHTHVHSHTTDVLAERNDDLETRARHEAEIAMRQGALDAGILTRAQRSAEQSLRTLLGAIGFEQIAVDFRPAIETRE